MIVDIENKSESTLLIEYNGRTYTILGNQMGQLEVDSASFQLTAHMDLIDRVDLELDNKKIKFRLLQKLVDRILKFMKKLMVQCKLTYDITLKTDRPLLEFEFAGIGKDNNFIQDLLDMPIEVSNFPRLECDLADISVIDCEAINQKEYLKAYRRTYLWINSGMGIITNLVMYLPSYIKQKILVSKKHLMKVYTKLYTVSREERDKLIEIK